MIKNEMTSKLTYKFFLSILIILNVGALASCSAAIPAPTPTVMVTRTVIPTKTPVPSATFTLTPEPSLTPTILPTISLPKEIISSQNISQIKQLESRELAGIPEEFLHRSLDFTPDGRIIVGDHENSVYVWDGFTGQQVVTLDHSSYLWNVAVSQDGTIAASGGESDIIKLWGLRTGEELHVLTHPGTIWNFAFSPDSTMLASGTLDQTIKFWNINDGTELDEISNIIVNSLVFSPDGKIVAIGTDDKIILWDIFAKKAIKTFVFDLRGGEGLSGIQGVLFSPDEKMIAAADADNIAMVWDISSEKKLSTIVGRGTIIRMSEGTLAFSSDSKMIAVGNDNGDVIFWDVLADKELHKTGSQECIPWDLIFWPDGKAFEMACWNGTIQLWGLSQT